MEQASPISSKSHHDKSRSDPTESDFETQRVPTDGSDEDEESINNNLPSQNVRNSVNKCNDIVFRQRRKRRFQHAFNDK